MEDTENKIVDMEKDRLGMGYMERSDRDMQNDGGINTEYNIIRERRAVISIMPETRERLKDLGRKGDTYDDIINKLIDAYTKE